MYVHMYYGASVRWTPLCHKTISLFSRQNNGFSKDYSAQTLNSQILEYVILHGRRDFADVVKVKDLKIGEVIREYICETKLITWVLKTGKERLKSGSEKCNGRGEIRDSKHKRNLPYWSWLWRWRKRVTS